MPPPLCHIPKARAENFNKTTRREGNHKNPPLTQETLRKSSIRTFENFETTKSIFEPTFPLTQETSTIPTIMIK